MDYQFSAQFNAQTGRFEAPRRAAHAKGFRDIVKLLARYRRRQSDPHEISGFPIYGLRPEVLTHFHENAIWVGHSTVLLNHAGVTILTDPHFTERASPLRFAGPKRVTPAPFDIAQLPKIDLVLISHNHYDHLDQNSIQSLARTQPEIRFLVPLGLAALLRKWGAQHVQEFDWWQSATLGDVTLVPTPVQHWSKRSPFDRNKALWCGWMVKWNDFSFFFAGDSGYSNDFKDTATRLGSPDLAAIPIGAYAPRDFMAMAHMDPAEAVQVFLDLGARHAIAIHWGTFKLTLEPMDEPKEKLAAALAHHQIDPTRFVALQHGQDWGQPFEAIRTRNLGNPRPS